MLDSYHDVRLIALAPTDGHLQADDPGMILRIGAIIVVMIGGGIATVWRSKRTPRA